MKTPRSFPLFTAILAAFALNACGGGGGIFKEKEEKRLEGERISVMELQQTLEPDDPILEAQGLVMPPEWTNDFWPQVGGYPNHSMQNLSLASSGLKRVWKTSIGRGSTDKLPLITQPVVFDGRIFTVDTKGKLSAFDTQNGKRLWRVDIRAKDEDDDVIPGGVAASAGLLYVTNGFNEVLALKPNDGSEVWRKTLPSASRAAPTVLNGRVFVNTLDNRLIALAATDGRVLWQHTGIADDAALVGAASPAANQDIVVPVFSSGEVSALRLENGSVTWSDNLSNVRTFGGISTITDIRALPVIDKGVVIAISFSGRIVAIDERTGNRIWQREISGSQTPWMAGNHLFVLSSDNQLIALGRETGAIRWVTELPKYIDDEQLILTGPVLAGGRLILPGSKGHVYEVAPENGEILGEWDAGKTITIPPVVAGGTLYLLNREGELAAYR